MDNDGATNSSKLTAKNIACDICKKSFKTKQSLNIHKRIHSGEKPYKCDICRISFIQKSNLTQHMLIHTGKKKLSMSFLWKILFSKK